MDALRRATHHYVLPAGGAEILVGRIVFGESAVASYANNLRARAVAVYDSAGVTMTRHCDFKGNILRDERRFSRFVADPEGTVDWSALAAITTPSAAATAAAGHLDAETFATDSAYDAINRVLSSALSSVAGGATQPLRSTTVAYDEGGLPIRISVALRGGARADYVTGVSYDEHGRRAEIMYRNGVSTIYTYDPLTFRLIEQRSVSAAGDVFQDISYVTDPVGNVVACSDASKQRLFFQNGVVSSDRMYVYDPLYQLVAAEGREHIGLGVNPLYDADDASRSRIPSPTDSQALRRYGETYAYDGTGNILEVVHRTGSATGAVLWRRRHAIAADSDRLLSTSMPGDGNGTLPSRYGYDAHGNTTSMPHLAEIDWDFADRLTHSSPGAGVDAYYTYDASGTRARQVAVKNNGSIIEERIYVGAYERFTRKVNGQTTLVRDTVHVLDGTARVAIVETDVTPGAAGPPAYRYQLADSLSSTVVELNENAALISTEEYSPFGTTTYQAGPNSNTVSLKRYRYAGKERDEITGFNRHGVRYYAPWLGRFTSCDSAKLEAGPNAYRYASNNPASRTDHAGSVDWSSPSGSNIIKTYNNLSDALSNFKDAADYYDAAGKEVGVYQSSTASNTFHLVEGTHDTVYAPRAGASVDLSAKPLAHSHVGEDSTPSGPDLETISDKTTGAPEHAIYNPSDYGSGLKKGFFRRLFSRAVKGANRTLIKMGKGAGEYVMFKDNGDVAVGKVVKGAGGWGRTLPRTVGVFRAALERLRASRGSEVARFAAQEGAGKWNAGAVIGGFLGVVGSGLGGYKLGTGINEMLVERKWALGAVDAGEGASSLALTIGSAIAVKAGVVTTGAGVVMGAATLAAGVAAGVGVGLAAESMRAAIKGEKTPVEKLDAKLGTSIGDLHGGFQRATWVPQVMKDIDKAQDDFMTNAYYNLFLK
jgi:RHS repeat-associated protein